LSSRRRPNDGLGLDGGATSDLRRRGRGLSLRSWFRDSFVLLAVSAAGAELCQ
jgi:hypothetical protein